MSRSSVKIKGQSIVQSEVQGRKLCDCDPTFGIRTRVAILVLMFSFQGQGHQVRSKVIFIGQSDC